MHNKLMSILLTVVMLLSICSIPTYAFASGYSVSIKDTTITEETESITVNIPSLPSLGILRVIQMEEGENYDSSKLNNYTSLNFSVVGNLTEGDNVLTLSSKPEPGKQIMAVLRDSGGEVADYPSSPVTVSSGSEQPGDPDNGGDEPGNKTQEEILANCSVQLMQDGQVRTENFKETDTSADVSVKLDDSIQKCYLTLYAYAGNTSFDPDSTYNKRLWAGEVTDGYTGTCDFSAGNLPLIKGYKIIACLNVPVGEDNYRPVNSQAIEIVDESGEGFTDYTYPDVTIDETELKAGDTSLHISLSGDERLFDAAKKGDVSITCAVAQYPDGESFDFESADQISLAGNISCTEGFAGKEIQLSEPLKEGYRVRAVVYWSQNVELFLAKGNDYEEMFHRPDDSVPVSALSVSEEPTAVISSPVLTSADNIEIMLGGNIPENAVVLIKSYSKDTTEFAMSGGTWVGSLFSPVKGSNMVTPQADSLKTGDKVVAFVQEGGVIYAQSEPVVIEEAGDFTVTNEGELTADSTTASFRVTANAGAAGNDFINMALLCKVDGEGNADTESYISRVFQQTPGIITFDIPAGSLNAGDKLCLVLTYNNANSTFTSDTFTVMAPLTENSLVIRTSDVTPETRAAEVAVSGCDEFKGGLLILTAGPASNTNDADSRTRVATVSFTGEGVYTLSWNNNVPLKAGETLLAHLYKYDSDKDTTDYKYSEPVMIKSVSGTVTEAKAEIATESIRADRTDAWIITEFDSTLTGTLKLYTYQGDDFDRMTAEEIYSGAATSSENSQRVVFGSDKLTAGKRFIAVLELSNGTSVKSDAKVIQTVPEKQKPAASILDSTVTAGDTYVKASLTFDASAANVTYKLYQFTGDTLDTDNATLLSSGYLYRSETNKSIYLGTGKLEVDATLQIVLTADGESVGSNVVTVEPSPDWGTPYAAFDVSAVKEDADSIPVTIDYSDEYLSLGDGFYCDVSIYQFSAAYTDDQFEDNELWESYGKTTRIGQINSNTGDLTKGQVVVPVRDGVTLNPGDRLIIKLRLPHTEWDGEEVDYVSVSVPVIGANEETPAYKVVLYNLREDSSRGERLRTILAELGIPAEEIDDTKLNESVGYLAGLEGYEACGQPYEGAGSTQEFMLICNLPESLLDRFLDSMMDNGLRIDHKAVVTEYNRDYLFYELLNDIEEEHDVFQALLQLDDMIKTAEKLSEDVYGSEAGWTDFKTALGKANDVLASYEPSLEELEGAYSDLKAAYLELTGMKEIKGDVVISIDENEDGTYNMTADVINIGEGLSADDFIVAWSNGRTGKTIENIPQEKLIAMTVTVTGKNMLGQLTAQLQVPDVPRVAATVKNGNIELSWETPTEKNNQPLPMEYKAQIYQNGEKIDELCCDGTETSMLFENLEPSKDYEIKFWAVSPVGRSDIQTLNVNISDDPVTTPGTDEPATDPGDGDGAKGNDPAAGSKNENDANGNDPDAGLQKSSSAENAVKTGDNSFLMLELMALILSALGIVVIRVQRDIKIEKIRKTLLK